MIPAPTGEKKRGRPKLAATRRDLMRQLAQAFRVSVRSIERAERVQRAGVPELLALVERGELKLAPAEFLAQFPHELQRGVIEYGPAHIRKWVALNRRAYAEERDA